MEQQADRQSTYWGITRRSLGLGALLVPVNCYWMLYMEVAWNQGYATLLSLYFNTVFTLTVLVVANLAVRRLAPRLALTRNELLVTFVMVNIGTSLAISLEYLVPILVYPFRYASPENHWEELIHPHLPSWLFVSDPEAVRQYYDGDAVFETRRAVAPWLLPLGLWGAFTLTVLGVMLCLNALVRRRWTEHERLSYPIVRIPLELAADQTPLRSVLFWIGFIIAAGLDTYNGLALFWPALPQIPIKRRPWYPTQGLSAPWNAIKLCPLSWHPFALGMAYFMPQDMLFSSWFFYWFAKAQAVAAAMVGWSWSGDDYFRFAPYLHEQSFGALIGLLAFAGWMARGSWLRRSSASDGDAARAREPLPPGVALAGVMGGLAALAAFLVAAGMSLGVALTWLVTFFAVSMAVTRLRAQFGPPGAGLFETAPNNMLFAAFGPRNLGPRNLTMLASLHWLQRMYSGSAMPHQLEAMKIAQLRGWQYRPLLQAIMLAGLLAIVASFWTILHLSYDLGQDTARVAQTQNYFGREPTMILSNNLGMANQGPNLGAVGGMLFGGGLAILLVAMQMRFVWWPFHPVGYALLSSYVTHILWLPMLLSWVLKAALLRYGGWRAHRQGIPLALGLILGEFVVGSLWGLIGVLIRQRTYVFWPY
ncbi:MAG: hypothetical protein HPY69_05485 [Armatimonadetes bacterium]|nr:hypothetical protein [Armatimonadota bacterium]